MAARARLALLALLAAALATSCARAAQQPNFIVILTDDQDRVLDSTNVKYMPKLQEHLARGGLELSNFRVSSPECCPSRVNLFLGRLTHNHNVTTYKPPYGSYDKFRALGLDEEYLPKWMQQKGYRTYFAGKLMNYFQPRPDGSYPKYWNDFWAFVHPYTYDYYE